MFEANLSYQSKQVQKATQRHRQYVTLRLLVNQKMAEIVQKYAQEIWKP